MLFMFMYINNVGMLFACFIFVPDVSKFWTYVISHYVILMDVSMIH